MEPDGAVHHMLVSYCEGCFACFQHNNGFSTEGQEPIETSAEAAPAVDALHFVSHMRMGHMFRFSPFHSWGQRQNLRHRIVFRR